MQERPGPKSVCFGNTRRTPRNATVASLETNNNNNKSQIMRLDNFLGPVPEMGTRERIRNLSTLPWWKLTGTEETEKLHAHLVLVRMSGNVVEDTLSGPVMVNMIYYVPQQTIRIL